MKRELRLYLDDILAAIERIEEYIQGMSFDEFSQDRKTIDAVVRNFEIIGEATKYIPDEMRAKYPKSPGKKWQGCVINSFTNISE